MFVENIDSINNQKSTVIPRRKVTREDITILSSLNIELILNVLERNPEYISLVNPTLLVPNTANEKFMMRCILRNHSIYFHLNKIWKSNKFIVEKLLKKDVNNFDLLDNSLRMRLGVNKRALFHAYPFPERLPRYKDLLEDLESCKRIIFHNPAMLLKFPERIHRKIELSEYLTNSDPMNVRYVPYYFRRNIDFMFPLIRKNALCIKYASYKLRNDSSIATIAIKNNHHAFNYLSEDLKKDDYFLQQAVQVNENIKMFISYTHACEIDNSEMVIPKIPMFPILSKDFVLTKSL